MLAAPRGGALGRSAAHAFAAACAASAAASARRPLTTLCAAAAMPRVTFEQTATDAPPGLPRSGACGVALPPGHASGFAAIIFGGYTEDADKQRAPSNEAWGFRSDAQAWERIAHASAAAPRPRLVAQAVVVGDALWLIGGWDSSVSGPDAFLSDVWRLDLSTWAWEAVVPAGEALAGISRFQAAAVGAKIFIHTHRCDDHVLLLDTAAPGGPALSKAPLAPGSPAPSSRGLHSMVALRDGLYLFGGAPQSGPMLDDCWRLDLGSMAWERRAGGPAARCSAAAAAVGGRYMLIVGGAFYGAGGGLEMLGDVALYDSEADAWATPAVAGAPPAARNAAVMLPLPHGDGGAGGGARLLLQGGWRAFVESYNDTFLQESLLDVVLGATPAEQIEASALVRVCVTATITERGGGEAVQALLTAAGQPDGESAPPPVTGLLAAGATCALLCLEGELPAVQHALRALIAARGAGGGMLVKEARVLLAMEGLPSRCWRGLYGTCVPGGSSADAAEPAEPTQVVRLAAGAVAAARKVGCALAALSEADAQRQLASLASELPAPEALLALAACPELPSAAEWLAASSGPAPALALDGETEWPLQLGAAGALLRSPSSSACAPMADDEATAGRSSGAPAWAVEAEQGRRPRQEDAFCHGALRVDAAGGATRLVVGGVFDGHGGALAARTAARQLAGRVAGALAGRELTPEAVATACATGFAAIDGELAASRRAMLQGSTAVLALVTPSTIHIASCGDSRAIICHAGRAVQPVQDHTPSRADEQARVEAAGGRVLYHNGCRVMGALAMSRALGDHALRPFGVIAEPDIAHYSRRAGDEFLLLASDGLWGVVSNEDAAELVSSASARLTGAGMTRQQVAAVLPKLLTKVALARGSTDNITVMLLDVAPAPHRPSSSSSSDSCDSACSTGTRVGAPGGDPAAPAPRGAAAVTAAAIELMRQLVRDAAGSEAWKARRAAEAAAEAALAARFKPRPFGSAAAAGRSAGQQQQKQQPAAAAPAPAEAPSAAAVAALAAVEALPCRDAAPSRARDSDTAARASPFELPHAWRGRAAAGCQHCQKDAAEAGSKKRPRDLALVTPEAPLCATWSAPAKLQRVLAERVEQLAGAQHAVQARGRSEPSAPDPCAPRGRVEGGQQQQLPIQPRRRAAMGLRALQRMGDALGAIMPPLEGEPIDMLLPLYIALGVLALRVVSERLIAPRLFAAFKLRLKGDDSAEKARKAAFNVFNNSFIAASSLLMTGWLWHATAFANHGCTPFNTKPCLVGWPDLPVTREFKLVWLTVFGFYLYEMIGTALRVGCVLSTDMVVHHLITMWMMLYGYFYSLGRYGLMATALLDTSNMLLHGAKALNYVVPVLPRLEGAKQAAFKAFAASFFVCRVLLPPLALIRPGLLDGRAMPLASYATTNGLLLFIYALQLFWFAKIVRIALGHEGAGEEAGANGSSAAAVSRAPRVKAA
ncbi:protein phosphatase 2C 68 [Scenedesmus sp. PABB004]|nr:protein phosphatase 2C 68 [Scenedesmus sp. PABB004]